MPSLMALFGSPRVPRSSQRPAPVKTALPTYSAGRKRGYVHTSRCSGASEDDSATPGSARLVPARPRQHAATTAAKNHLPRAPLVREARARARTDLAIAKELASHAPARDLHESRPGST